MFTRGVLSSLAFALVLAHARPSLAQPEPSAQRVYEQGEAAFEVRDFATALARFQRAYVLTRRPALLLNVAVTFERLGRRDDAIAAYRSYLAIGAPTDRAAVEATIARLEHPPVVATVVAPVVVPVVAPVVAAPVVAPPAVTAPVVAAPSPWPYVVLGAGGLLAVVGVALMVVPTDPGADPSVTREFDYLAARDTRTSLQTGGAVLGAVGVVGAAVGAVALLLRPGARPSRLTWAPGVRSVEGGALVGVSHAF